MHDFVEHLPLYTTVLLVAGPPCQDLTSVSANAGKRGLCGDRSCHFYAVPLAAWCMQKLRPDLRIHTVVENASSMKLHFKQEFLRALNIVGDHYAQTLDSGQWCRFSQEALLLLHAPARPASPAARGACRATLGRRLVAAPRWGDPPHAVLAYGAGALHTRLYLTLPPQTPPLCPRLQARMARG